MMNRKIAIVLFLVVGFFTPNNIKAEIRLAQEVNYSGQQTNNPVDSTTQINILVKSIPPGASLFFNGVLVGHTPMELNTSMGKQHFSLWLYGHKRLSTKLLIKSNTNTIEFELDEMNLSQNKKFNIRYPFVINDSSLFSPSKDFIIEDYARYQLIKKYNRKFTAGVSVAVATGIISIGSLGIANDKYDQYKNSYDNRSELKRKIKSWDAVFITSTIICLASTTYSIYISKLKKRAKHQTKIDISLGSTPSGAGLEIIYKLP